MALMGCRNTLTIIWLDSALDHIERKPFVGIRNLIQSIEIFHNLGDCIQFLDLITTEPICLIITDSFHLQRDRLIVLIDETIQIESVYILSNDQSQAEQWKTDCRKFQGLFPEINSLCHALKQSIPRTSIISSIDPIPDDIDPLYIYSKLLTLLIHQIDYDEDKRKAAFNFCREYYANSQAKLQDIDDFEQNYQHHTPIWWYTKETPINVLLREALITHNFDWMIRLGFFIQDLHRQIKQIHFEANPTMSFTTFRGQGMSNEDFEKFLERKGCLYAFHNINSTSTDRETALNFANSASIADQTIGIVFQMEIDPLKCPTVFANVHEASYYEGRESEILFSTHSIFRIEDISQTGERLWKVILKLPCDIDQQLHSLTDSIRQQIQGVNVYHSLALFFHQIGRYNKAIEYFNQFSEMITDVDQKQFLAVLASTENNVALMNDLMGDYSTALIWYEKILEMEVDSSSISQSSLAIVYNNIGMTYRAMGNYRQALLHCEKSLNIRLKSSSDDKTALTTIYSNIGQIYESKGEYLTALSFYKKAYKIQKCSLPMDDPSMVLSYNNFAGIHIVTGQYSKALSSYQNTLEIQNRFLVPDHPSIAITHNNIGHVYQLLGNYQTALYYYEEAMRIQQTNALLNQLALATTFNNIGLVYRLMGDFSIALLYYEKSLIIEEACLSLDHPSLASTYNNLGALYQSMGEYDKSLESYRKAHDIWQPILPLNHPSLAAIENNAGCLYDLMGDRNKALVSYQAAIDILSKSPLANPLELASTYNNLGELHRSMADYPNALLYYEKTLELEEKHLSSKHPSLAITLSNMAVALDANNQCADALQHAQRAFDISSNALGTSHSQSKTIREFLEQLRQKKSTSNST